MSSTVDIFVSLDVLQDVTKVAVAGELPAAWIESSE